MNRDLQEGRILQDRFVLERRLRGDAATQLWFARDRHLDTQLLLRVYFVTGVPERGLREIVARDARQHRGLQHPNVARIFDVHEEEGLLFVSLAPHEGELLSDVVQRVGPVPYRQVVAQVRPLIDALRHQHDRGGEHGRVDLDHVLVDGEHRWTLLPGDATRPARPDARQLGHLIAALLTGGREPDAGRELNDMPERLHEGRTVPALLNQLVSDLMASDATMRSAGMPEVSSRLDQIEQYVAVEPAPVNDAAPASAPVPASVPESVPASVPASASSPVSVSVPRPARLVTGTRLAWLLVPAILIGGVIVFRPSFQPRDEQQAAVEPTPEPVADTPSDPSSSGDSGAPETPDAPDAPNAIDPAGAPDQTPSAEDEAKLIAERQAADEALNRYLEARRKADEIGAGAWGGEPYKAAAVRSGQADAFYLEQQFVDAAAAYVEAAEAFDAVVAGQADALRRLLAEGAAAIDDVEAELATQAYQLALLIDPGNDDARVGLQRAATLDELDRLLSAGLAHEAEGALSLAHIDFASASKLDPHSEDAAASFERIKQRLVDEEFQAIMSRGLNAYHRGDYDEARATLLEAQRFRPDAEGITEALRMVAEARVRDEVDRLRDQARTHEQQEQWQDAWNAYRQVLAIDAAIEYAQKGKTRCERMIRIEKHARHFLDNPDLLIKRGSREDAAKLVEEIERLKTKGPRLQRAYAELAQQVRLANTPMRVVLQSDEETEVDVYRVGRFGAFRTKAIELLPGEYTVVGHRRGYKDVRLTLRLKPGEQGATLEVICTESIG